MAGLTPTQAITSVRDQYGESASGFFTDAEIRSYLWDAERQLNTLLECNQVSTSITTTTGTNNYANQGLLSIGRVTYDGEKLKKIDYRQLDLLDDDATQSAQTGEPTHYYEYGSSIYLWPTPDASATVKIWGFDECAQITSASTAFTIPGLLTNGLPDYALMRMSAKDNDDGKTMFYGSRWADAKKEAPRLWMRHRMKDKLALVKDKYVYPGTTLGMA